METPTRSHPLRVLQISDPHLFAQRDETLLNVNTDASLRGVLTHIRQHEAQVDVVLATGDIAQDASVQAYQSFLDLTRPLAPVLRGLPGNHDAADTFYQVWATDAQAVTDIGNWRLVMLDSTIPRSSAGNIAKQQLELLRHALQTADGRHVLVAVHHNPVPVGSLWLDAMMIDNGHELLTTLHKHNNVQALVWGHVHQAFDSVISFGHHSVRLLATPSTCVQFTPHSSTFSLDKIDPGYRRIALHEDGRIETEVIRVSGLGLEPDTSSSGY